MSRNKPKPSLRASQAPQDDYRYVEELIARLSDKDHRSDRNTDYVRVYGVARTEKPAGELIGGLVSRSACEAVQSTTPLNGAVIPREGSSVITKAMVIVLLIVLGATLGVFIKSDTGGASNDGQESNSNAATSPNIKVDALRAKIVQLTEEKKELIAKVNQLRKEYTEKVAVDEVTPGGTGMTTAANNSQYASEKSALDQERVKLELGRKEIAAREQQLEADRKLVADATAVNTAKQRKLADAEASQNKEQRRLDALEQSIQSDANELAAEKKILAGEKAEYQQNIEELGKSRETLLAERNRLEAIQKEIEKQQKAPITAQSGDDEDYVVIAIIGGGAIIHARAPKLADALRIARLRCGGVPDRDCELHDITNECFSLARSRNKVGYAVAVGPSRKEAGEQAVSVCNYYNGGGCSAKKEEAGCAWEYY